jgi:molybdopterin synthase sulfur carrier subunit
LTVAVFRTYGHLTAITKAHQLELRFDGATVQDLLDELVRRFGEPMHAILYPQGTLSSLLYVLVNGKNVGLLAGTGTELKDGDIVSVLPVTAGG